MDRIKVKTRESSQYLPCEFLVIKSKLQIKLEAQGCRFNGQELLKNHESDLSKSCQCGRPNK